jgi:hypothetical protein
MHEVLSAPPVNDHPPKLGYRPGRSNSAPIRTGANLLSHERIKTIEYPSLPEVRRIASPTLDR